MRTTVDRRVFVGSVVGGLPVLTGAGIFAQSSAGAPHTHGGNPSAQDPVMEHLVRQLATTYNSLRARAPRGEDARLIAANFRTLAIYGRHVGLDQQIREGVRALVEKEGRDAVLYLQRDPNQIRADLKRYGFDVDERMFRAGPNPDYATRSASLQRLLTSGVTPAWDRMAAGLEEAAARIDRRSTLLVRATAAQDDPSWWAGFCSSLSSEIQEVQLWAEVICLLSTVPGMLWVVPTCAAFAGALALLFSIYVILC